MRADRFEEDCKILVEILDDEAKKKNIAFNYNMNVEHDQVPTDITKARNLANIISNAKNILQLAVLLW